jgi:hypothetical protein
LLLILAGLEWVRTTVALVSRRQEAEEPWIRLAVILGAVALFTVASALVFRSAALRARYTGEPLVGEGRDS